MDINYNKLIQLESLSNIKIFRIKNNILTLRNLQKIIYDCNKMIKKKIIELSINIKNITFDDINSIKNQCILAHDKALYDIDNLQSIINIINNIDTTSFHLNSQKKFIEIYSN